MQISSKLFHTAILVLVLMLALALYLSLSLVKASTAKGVVAAGCSSQPTDWAKVQCYVDQYIQSQATTAGYGGGSNTAGKSGYFIDRSTQSNSLQNELDSNGNGTILGEGDDLKNAPVLIDNLGQLTTMIPGTSFRCIWNSATANCFDSGAVADIKTLVDNHEAATGAVPDIVDYCMTDHTEAPTVGGLGYIAQTGGLATDGSVPKIYGLTYGRDGWTNTQADTYTNNTRPLMPFSTPTTYTPPNTVPNSCNSSGGDADLVRCAAEWSITNGATYGNAGNGLSPNTSAPYFTGGTGASTSQIVDIRSGLPVGQQTIDNNSGATPAISDPIGTVFNNGLANVDDNSGDTILVASASQNTGGIVAEGLTMLGYHVTTKTTATATSPFGGYIHGGVDYYNNTLAGVEQNTAAEGSSCPSGGTYPTYWDCLQTVSAWSTYGDTDTTPPTISTSSATATGDTTATVSRTVSTPATTKIDLVGSDSSQVHTNNTILHASDTENLTGLHPGVTYTGTLTVYDNQALSASAPISFTTTGIACAKPALTLSTPHAYWATLSDYSSDILSVDWTISNGVSSPTAIGVQILTSSNTNGVTVNSGVPSAAVNIAAGASATSTIKYNLPTNLAGFSWHTSTTAGAQDECGNKYTYP